MHKVLRGIGREVTKYYFYAFYYFYKLSNKNIKSKIQNTLRLDESSINLERDSQEEQALPGMSKYVKNRWYKYMFGRYLFSLRYIKNKSVLDAGCGLGWGSYLIADAPRELIAVDIDDSALAFAKERWGSAADFRKLSVLELARLNRKFDVVLGYEVIEHLDYLDGERYIGEISKVLRNNGVLILSSDFPNSERFSMALETKNKFHLHIYTKKEMLHILRKNHFHKIKFYGDLIITAHKMGNR